MTESFTSSDLPTLEKPEFERRWSALQGTMEVENLDLVLAYGDDRAVFGSAHVRYLTNFPVHFEPACVLIARAGEPILAAGPETATHAEIVAHCQVEAVEEFSVPGEEYPYLKVTSVRQLVAELLAGSRSPRIGVAGLGDAGVDIWQRIADAIGDCELIRVDEQLTRARKRKSAAELAVLRHAFTLTQAGTEAALAACVAGAREFEVAAAAEHAMRVRGAEGTAIDTIVASGSINSRPIIGRTGRRRIEKPDHVALTLAPRYEGYGAPIGRLITLGDVPEELKTAADVALQAQRLAAAALVPGALCSEVDDAARSFLREQGHEKYAAYGVAHSVGVQEFEPPFFGPSNRDVVEKDMVVSIDIPMYFGPWGGFRIEDSFVVTERGAQHLTTVPEGRITV